MNQISGIKISSTQKEGGIDKEMMHMLDNSKANVSVSGSENEGNITYQEDVSIMSKEILTFQIQEKIKEQEDKPGRSCIISPGRNEQKIQNVDSIKVCPIGQDLEDYVGESRGRNSVNK